MPDKLTCRLCHGAELKLMVDFGRRPIAHRLLPDAAATEQTFPMALHVCLDCGMVQILEPIDPEVLYKGFNYNFSSWKPEPHLPAELDTIMAVGPHASAFEIGCNDGRFLAELRDRGVTRPVGLEPNAVPGGIARERGLTIYESWVTPEMCAKAIDENGGKFDLVVSRQVIEHVLDLDNFFTCIDLLLSDDGWLFLDMPDFELGMKMADCSTVWEEHVSYFSWPVLETLMRRHGFTIMRQDWYDFSSGCLSALARRSKAEANTVDKRVPGIVALASDYGDRLATYNADLKEALTAARDGGAEVVLYGVGVRGCCAVNGLDLGAHIDFAVDDQPERISKFMPGCRLPIKPSAVLTEQDGPLVVLLAVNNENDDKVIAKVRQMVTRPAHFLTLCSPTDIGADLLKFQSSL